METIVTNMEASMRLDTALAALVPELSRSRVRHLIDNALVQVNEEPAKASLRLKEGDRISWTNLQEPPPVTNAEDIPLNILFEDEHLLVLNKPANMVVHPAVGNWSGTLVNALLHHCGELPGAAARPGIVHRLDKDTTGCMVIAKTPAAHASLAAQFAGRDIYKLYLAIAAGYLRKTTGEVDAPLGRDPRNRQRMAVLPEEKGRAALTRYQFLQPMGANCLVACRLLTGRTHQIRVHLKHIGNPLCGDTTYAGRRAGPYSRPMLHAFKLGFTHPHLSNWMEFEAAMPDDFLAAGADPPEAHTWKISPQLSSTFINSFESQKRGN